MNQLKSIYASAYAATLSILVTVIITIRMEFSPAFKTWLASFTGHHWVTKSWISLLVFLVFFVIFRMVNKSPSAEATKKALTVLAVSAILGFVVLVGFFMYEFLTH